ncbi:MAG: hypothetical protein FJY21_07065 [Bacteroidetes bacterium]|nr:hypothetical protein [Bacteroidota bacterium]
MDQVKLLNKLSKALTKMEVIQIAKDQSCRPLKLLNLSLYPEHEIAFRAAWVLEQFLYYRLDDLVEILPEYFSAYSMQKNPSCQRHLSKILIGLTDKGSAEKVKAGLSQYQDQIIETTFDWLINPETPVAVKANCMDILLYFTKENLWIAEELQFQVQFLLKNSSAALQSRGKRVLKKIKTSYNVL